MLYTWSILPTLCTGISSQQISSLTSSATSGSVTSASQELCQSSCSFLPEKTSRLRTRRLPVLIKEMPGWFYLLKDSMLELPPHYLCPKNSKKTWFRRRHISNNNSINKRKSSISTRRLWTCFMNKDLVERFRRGLCRIILFRGGTGHLRLYWSKRIITAPSIYGP